MEKKPWGLIRDRYHASSMSYDTLHMAQCNLFLLHAATLWYDVNNTALYNKYKSLCDDFLCFGFIYVVSVWKQLDTMVNMKTPIKPELKQMITVLESWMHFGILMYECRYSYLVRTCCQQGSLYKVANHHHHHRHRHQSVCSN